MADKSYRLPLEKDQQKLLAVMLDKVPSRKVMMYDWTSEAGRTFLKSVREVQITGVPLPWIAEAMDISPATLQNAIGYYEQPTKARRGGRQKAQTRIPLRKATEGDG